MASHNIKMTEVPQGGLDRELPSSILGWGALLAPLMLAAGALCLFHWLRGFSVGKLVIPKTQPAQSAQRALSVQPRVATRTSKTESGTETFFSWALSEKQGWRASMEDATLVALRLALPPPLDRHNLAMFGVFDGHGGPDVARWVAAEITEVFVLCLAELSASKAHEASAFWDLCQLALTNSFLRLDLLLYQKEGANPENGRHQFFCMGTTAVVALLERDSSGRPRRYAVASCGDSRAVACRAGQTLALSEDHKPELKAERERIERAGGKVVNYGPCSRIAPPGLPSKTGINMSRALGDFIYKGRADLPETEQQMVALPDVRTHELTAEDDFLLLACDGVFEKFSREQAVKLVRQGLCAGHALPKVVEDLADASIAQDCYEGAGLDNVSALLVHWGGQRGPA
eukprot:TRINITY_DN75402_c0_g1_i1.p1 TRINITY_DN75402_c0_g1~~TRINITY_DN75402_c0_g1_i1.p1  ORF type:complete len:402 (-),score=62.34 TRINITY_DN75402_c0_g1_i1:38-1243(-)